VAFEVLTVCTGNICRSPYAQLLLQAAYGEDWGVESAGTGAWAGEPMDPRMVGIAGEAISAGSIIPDGHRARVLTADHVREADLILTADREHRRAVVTLVPSASARTFTMPEFDRLLADAAANELIAPGAGYREIVETTHYRRGIAPPPEAPEADDIADPYGGTDDEYRAAARRIAEFVASVAAHMPAGRTR
jgi:protein-tyrosine phosphatase